MCIVDLHNIKLLYDFVVDNDFLVFEWSNNCFAEVNCDDIIQELIVFNFFVGLLKIQYIRKL